MVCLLEEGLKTRTVTLNMATILPDGRQQVFKPNLRQGANEAEIFRDAELTWKRPGGAEHKISGPAAAYSALDAEGNNIYLSPDQMHQQAIARGYNDVRDSSMYQVGQTIRKTLLDKKPAQGWWKTIKDNTPKPLLAAGLVGGGAALASWLANRVGGYDTITPTQAALIAAPLAAGGYMYMKGHQGRLLNQQKLNTAMAQLQNAAMTKLSSMNKSAALYHDPRNFVLEKLQRDTELSMSDKAMIAGKIRNMSMPEASKLERMVRSAVGVGVGAMLAKYFGVGGAGALLGAAIGGLAFNAMGFGGDLLAGTRKPSMYNAFHNGGIGFKTYNEFFRSIR